MFSCPRVRAARCAHRVPGRGAGFLRLGLLLQPAREFGDLRTGERSSRQDNEIGAGIRGRTHITLSEWQDQPPPLYPKCDEPPPPRPNAPTLPRGPQQPVPEGKANRGAGVEVRPAGRPECPRRRGGGAALLPRFYKASGLVR